MKKIINTVFYLSLLMLPLSGQAGQAVVNEGVALSVHLNNSLNGYATIKRCPDCDEIQLNIDSTTLVTHKGKTIPLRNIRHLQLPFATVVYDSDTKHLQQINW